MQCSINAADLEKKEVVNMIKAWVGKTGKCSNISWIYKVGELTFRVQNNLENAISNAGSKQVSLTLDSFILFLKAKIGKCSKKRKGDDSLSEYDQAKKLLCNPVYNLLYTALALSVLVVDGFGWLEDDMGKVEDLIEKLEGKESDSAVEKREKLEEVKETMDSIHGEYELVTIMHEEMMHAILRSNVYGIIDSVQEIVSEYALDIGSEP
jgi:hypothetical protein